MTISFDDLLAAFRGRRFSVNGVTGTLSLLHGEPYVPDLRINQVRRDPYLRDRLLNHLWWMAKGDDDPRCPDCPRRTNPTGEVLTDDITGEEFEILCDVPECPGGQERTVDL